MSIDAVGYLRVSTIAQTEKYSLQAQKAEIEKFALNNNLNLKGFYIDSGITGKSMDKRDNLKKLIEDSSKGIFQKVIVWKISRLARNLQDLLTIVKEIKANNVDVISVSENLDTTTRQGEFTIQMLGSIAELEVEVINENIKNGIHQSIKQGYYAGSPVLGYDIIPRDTCKAQKLKSNLKVNKEADTVKLIFKLRNQGFGYKKIVNFLNENNYRGKQGRVFSISTVRSILTRRLYTGYMESNINSKNQIIKGNHEPIISEKLWNTVNKKSIETSKIQPKTDAHNFKLNKMIVCNQCGKMLCGVTQRRKNKDGSMRVYYYYKCNSITNRGSTACNAKLIPALEIEHQVYSVIKKVFENPSIIVDVQNRLKDKDLSFKDNVKMLNSLIEAENKLKSKKSNLLLQFEEDKVDEDSFSKQIKQIKEESEHLKSEKVKIQEYLEEHTKNQISIDLVKDTLSKVTSIIFDEEAEGSKEILQLLISKIRIDEDRNLQEVELKISDKKIQISAKEEEYEQADRRHTM